ncbi:uncharacterized protein V1510DRAFT_409833 [Dipodascopsis tothii]|uniref:uncharacterized protein n=1 Tax=Dipodascopsis tothii TaxID=44089 RepID=UPI0034CFB32E
MAGEDNTGASGSQRAADGARTPAARAADGPHDDVRASPDVEDEWRSHVSPSKIFYQLALQAGQEAQFVLAQGQEMPRGKRGGAKKAHTNSFVPPYLAPAWESISRGDRIRLAENSLLERVRVPQSHAEARAERSGPAGEARGRDATYGLRATAAGGLAGEADAARGAAGGPAADPAQRVAVAHADPAGDPTDPTRDPTDPPGPHTPAGVSHAAGRDPDAVLHYATFQNLHSALERLALRGRVVERQYARLARRSKDLGRLLNGKQP